MFNNLSIYSNSVSKLEKALRRDLENLSTYHERYAALCLLEEAINNCYTDIQPLATSEVLGTPEYKAAAANGGCMAVLSGGTFTIRTKNEYPLDTVPEYTEKLAAVKDKSKELDVLNKELKAIKERVIFEKKLAPISSKISLSFTPQKKPAK